MSNISAPEIILLLLVALLLFGAKRLPEIGSSLGRGIRGFKDSLNGRDQLESSVSAAARHEATSPIATPVPVEVVETPSDERR